MTKDEIEVIQDIAVVRLSGWLLHRNTVGIRRVLAQARRKCGGLLIVDVADCEHMTTSVARTIATIHRIFGESVVILGAVGTVELAFLAPGVCNAAPFITTEVKAIEYLRELIKEKGAGR